MYCLLLTDCSHLLTFAARQAYIGFGMAHAQAALLEVDAIPMKRFDNQGIRF